MSRSGSPFHYFSSSPEVIRLAAMMYVRSPLSLRNVEDLLFGRGIDICIDICHETVRLWCNRLGGVVKATESLLSYPVRRLSEGSCQSNMAAVSGDW